MSCIRSAALVLALAVATPLAFAGDHDGDKSVDKVNGSIDAEAGQTYRPTLDHSFKGAQVARIY